MNDDKGMQRIGQMGLAQFEPRDFTELEKLARMAAASKLFAVQSVEAAIVIMLTGASLGIPPVVAMRSIHVVQGRAVLSSDLIHALVRRSGFCVTWAVEETTAEKCTITTQRRGEPLPYTHSWTAAMARTADLANKATWRQYPAAMLRARCTAEIARIVYPDVLMAGVYCEGEVEEDDAPAKSEPETRRPAIDATASPLQLPRDNGPSPSGAPLPTAEAPIVEAPPVALPLSDRDLRAMIDELRGCATIAALRTSIHGMSEDAERGTDAQREELRATFAARKAALTPPTPAEEPPPDGPPKPPRGPKRGRTPVAPADATGGGAEGADGPVGDPSAIDRSGARASNGASLESRDARRCYLATLDYAPAIRTSALRRSDLPHYVEDCAARLCALDALVSPEMARAYLDAAPLRVVASQPKTRAA